MDPELLKFLGTSTGQAIVVFGFFLLLVILVSFGLFVAALIDAGNKRSRDRVEISRNRLQEQRLRTEEQKLRTKPKYYDSEAIHVDEVSQSQYEEGLQQQQ